MHKFYVNSKFCADEEVPHLTRNLSTFYFFLLDKKRPPKIWEVLLNNLLAYPIQNRVHPIQIWVYVRSDYITFCCTIWVVLKHSEIINWAARAGHDINTLFVTNRLLVYVIVRRDDITIVAILVLVVFIISSH